MKTTVKHVGSGGPDREWEGLEENWLAHRDVIIHWCDDGEVEYCQGLSWTRKRDDLEFVIDCEYRIKQREPKCGEVYEVSGDFYIVHPLNDHAWIRLDGQGFVTSNHQDAKYSAPSVEAYYARKFLSDAKENRYFTEEVLKAASKLEK